MLRANFCAEKGAWGRLAGRMHTENTKSTELIEYEQKKYLRALPYSVRTFARGWAPGGRRASRILTENTKSTEKYIFRIYPKHNKGKEISPCPPTLLANPSARGRASKTKIVSVLSRPPCEPYRLY